jgi:cytochrome P450
MGVTTDAAGDTPVDVATPRVSAGAVANLLSSQWAQETAAHIAAKLAALWDKPLRLSTKVIVARHAQVTEVLLRDLDFLIAPVNAKRIDEVNGAFVLGMDRASDLATERQALYRALGSVDLKPIRRAVSDQATALVATAMDIDVVGAYARPVAADTARTLFGISEPRGQVFEDVVRSIFAHTFLNLSNDKTVGDRAVRASKLMRKWFEDEIRRRSESQPRCRRRGGPRCRRGSCRLQHCEAGSGASVRWTALGSNSYRLGFQPPCMPGLPVVERGPAFAPGAAAVAPGR